MISVMETDQTQHNAADRTQQWSTIVEQNADAVFRLAYRLTGNKSDAEDLTQDTFMRAFKALEGYTSGNFSGWLHRITTNLFLDKVRRDQNIRMEALSTEYEPEHRYDSKSAQSKTPEQIIEAQELDPALGTALDRLHPEYRVAIVLHEVVGMSYEEIADTVGVKMGTVRSRIHRARTQLREALVRQDNGDLTLSAQT